MTQASLCTREGCQVQSTGKCLEGFEPPNTCPYLSSTHATPTGHAASIEVEAGAFVDLPSGEALSEAQAAEVTRQGATRVVVVAGPSGSGKTTIVTSLFEAFLEAPFGNFLFAGSRTLIGFERRCHDARTTSGRAVAHTLHTPVEVTDFLHLRLVPASGSVLGPQNLLLSDISGERFRALRDSADAVKKMPMLRRADHLCVVLDGEKLADPKQRHAARTDARMLLRSLIEANALGPNCQVQIVFSKWDLVLAHPLQDSLLPFIAETKEALQSVLRDEATSEVFEIAARPTNRKLPFAFGLPTLLRLWLREPPMPDRVNLYLPRPHKAMREAARFATAVFDAGESKESYDVHWV